MRSQSTPALTAASTTPLAATSPGTGRHTGAWTLTMLNSATSVTRCTSACRPSPCTSWPTTSTTSASFVGKLSPALGCCRDTWGPTQGTSLTTAMFVGNHLLTDRIWGRTCRHIPPQRISNVLVVRSPSHWSLIWTNTLSLPVTKYTLMCKLNTGRSLEYSSNICGLSRISKVQKQENLLKSQERLVGVLGSYLFMDF